MRSRILIASTFTLSGLWLATQTACTTGNSQVTTSATETTSQKTTVASSPAPEPTPPVIADAATILGKTEVPILCYHQIRDYKSSDSKTSKAYIVPVDRFAEQMKALADSGYHSILPDQLFDYLVKGTPLPSKPVMITFDDTRLDQYTAALPQLNKYGFKGVFFIMTVSLGRPGYMSTDQVKQLADKGHEIGSHTWDHHNVKQYATDQDWTTQIVKPSKQLQNITGKPINYFAYPFGLWNKQAIAGLRKHGDFRAVFQLSSDLDDKDPLYSIRRIIVPGCTAQSMLKSMRNSF